VAQARPAVPSFSLPNQIAPIKPFPRLPPASKSNLVAAPAALPEKEAEPSAPFRFNVNMALKSARKFAGEQSSKGDPAVAQLQDKPINDLKTETTLGRAIGRAARPDCKTLASGSGILALVIVPIVVLTDKKDSGCKW
jgi:hypothetical protein